MGFEARYGVSRVVQVYRGGVRREFTEDGIATAATFSTDPLVEYDDGDVGVLWRTLTKAVLRSPTVLGPLERVEGLQATALAVIGSVGFACTTERKLLAVSMSGPPSVRALGRECTRIERHGEDLLLEHPPGTWVRSSDAGASFAPSQPPSPSDWDYGWLAARARAHDELDAVERTDRLLQTWRDDTGRILGFSRSLVGSDRPGTSSVVHRLDDDGDWSLLRGPFGISCVFSPSDRGLIAACDGDEGLPYRVFEYRGAWVERFAGAPAPRPRETRVRALVSRVDGSLVLSRPCDLDWTVETDAENTPFPICLANAGEASGTLWTWSVPTQPVVEEDPCEYGDPDCEDEWFYKDEREGPPSVSMHDYQFPYLLLREEGVAVHVLDVRVGEVGLDALPTCLEARWVGPGWLKCTTGSSEPMVLAHIEDEEVDTISIPKRARSVAFADAQHGLASGGTAEALWTTEDGGSTWDRVDAVPLEGHPSHLRLDAARCTNAVCSARPFVWGEADLLPRFELPDVRFIAPTEPAAGEDGP